MKKCFVILAAILMSLYLCHFLYGATDIPGRTQSWVNDYASVINKETREYLEGLSSSINNKTPYKVELIIATFKDTGEWKPQDFVREYGEKWRLTKAGKDNGVIIFMSLKENFFTIGVGQNLYKDTLTPQMVRVITDNMTRQISEGNQINDVIKKCAETILGILNKAEIPPNRPIAIHRIISILTAIAIIVVFVKLSK